MNTIWFCKESNCEKRLLVLQYLYISFLQDCPGITFLTMQEIYSQIASLQTKTCEIGISYLEVYNEMVRDLLCPGGKNIIILS